MGLPDAAAGEPGAARLRVDPGGQRRLAGIPLAGAAEDREDAVAHELEHLAALALDRVDQDLGMIVEQAQDLGVAGEQLQHAAAGDLVDQAGEAGEVAVPDHGVDHLDLAALDIAAEHPAGGVRTEIGREQRAGRRGAQRRGDHHGQQRLDARDPIELGLGVKPPAGG